MAFNFQNTLFNSPNLFNTPPKPKQPTQPTQPMNTSLLTPYALSRLNQSQSSQLPQPQPQPQIDNPLLTPYALSKLNQSGIPSTSPTQPTIQKPPVPQSTPTPAKIAPVAPIAQTTTPTTPTTATPVLPSGLPTVAPTGTTDVAQGATSAGSSPTVPSVSPEALKALDLAEKAYQKSMEISPEALSTQGDLDKLIESTKTAYRNTSGQAIPLEFITGQLASIERRATGLAEPLERKLARMQAARTSSTEASKFSLDKSQKAMEGERARAQTAKEEAESARRFGVEQAGSAATRTMQAQKDAQNKIESDRKFEEDKRQFGLDYAIKQRQVAVQELEAKTKASEAGGTKAASESLAYYNQTNDILNNKNLSSAIGKSGLVALPFSEAQAIKKQINQIKSAVELNSRAKLKGQGSITDREMEILANAATALDKYSSDEQTVQQLKNIRGVFANAGGMEASILVTPPSGQPFSTTATREEIDAVIKAGGSIKYQ